MRSINKNHEFAKMWGAARNLNFAEVSCFLSQMQVQIYTFY